MASPLLHDPYVALGVAKDATAQAIKTQYRKLVLKFHPDKVPDEAQKQAAADQFHKIQTAYEVIGDDDRRRRYDAQCKLADLKREVMEKQGVGRAAGGAEARTPAFKGPTDPLRGSPFPARGPDRAERASPTFEECRPSYTTYGPDYFEQPVRPTARKTPDYEREREHEREAKRRSPREERARASAKESERSSRKEKTRRVEIERKRARERKQAYVEEYSSDESHEYERAGRRMKDEELERVNHQYHETLRRQSEDARQGVYDFDPVARKVFFQSDEAQEYMSRSQRRPDSERRPSPPRRETAKDSKVEYVKPRDGPPIQIRRGSSKPRLSPGDVKPHRSSRERRPSADFDELPRRPPPLNQSRSSPADIRLPSEKPRSQSVQIDVEPRDDAHTKIKRAETMPHPLPREKSRREGIHKGSGLRNTEFADGLATPGATPEYAEPPTHKYHYGHHQQYADDNELPTPDGYRTEIREPAGSATRPRHHRNTSPPPREKTRTTSARHADSSPQAPRAAPPFSRTVSTSYKCTSEGVEHVTRHDVSRENSGHHDSPLLFGEFRPASSPKLKQNKNAPQPENVRYQHLRPEAVKMQSGSSTRRPSATTRPSYTRRGSGGPIYVV